MFGRWQRLVVKRGYCTHPGKTHGQQSSEQGSKTLTKSRFGVVLTLIAILALAHVSPSLAKKRKPAKKETAQEAIALDVPHCMRKLGTVSVVDGDDPSGWTQYQLPAPQKLLKVLIQRSGCFNLVDRGTGLLAAERERGIGGNLGLVRGANVGRGQVRAADYVLVAEIGKRNTSAEGVGAAVGGMFGTRTGNIGNPKIEANTTLALTNVRTTETVAEINGYARGGSLKSGTAPNGFLKRNGAVGGGYDDTDAGRVVTLAFIQAYSKLVRDLGLLQPGAVDAAPTRLFVTEIPAALRVAPGATSKALRTVRRGELLYPTGNESGRYREVADENGDVGWIITTTLSPVTGSEPGAISGARNLTSVRKEMMLLTPGAAEPGGAAAGGAAPSAMASRSADTRPTIELRSEANAGSKVIKRVPSDSALTRTGNYRSGFTEVVDSAGTRGWIKNQPRK